jgi:hypothetical protein
MLQHLSSVYDTPEETIYERPSTCGQLVASRGDSGGGDWTMPVLEQNRSVPNPETGPNSIHFIAQNFEGLRSEEYGWSRGALIRCATVLHL